IPPPGTQEKKILRERSRMASKTGQTSTHKARPVATTATVMARNSPGTATPPSSDAALQKLREQEVNQQFLVQTFLPCECRQPGTWRPTKTKNEKVWTYYHLGCQTSKNSDVMHWLMEQFFSRTPTTADLVITQELSTVKAILQTIMDECTALKAHIKQVEDENAKLREERDTFQKQQHEALVL
ncbi:hypothetical protein HK102_001924, partial [Quaeritorhiza haematococci]